jgi:hypothetical protein
VQVPPERLVVPLLRNLHFMPVCHEVGVAVFDITRKMLANYYHSKDEFEALTARDKADLASKAEEVRKNLPACMCT